MLPGLRLVIAGILFAVVFPMIAFGIAANFRSANGTTLSPFTVPGLGPAQPEYYWSQLYAPARINPAGAVRDDLPTVVAAAPSARQVESDAIRPPSSRSAALREAIAAQPFETPKAVAVPRADETAISSEPKAAERPKAAPESDARADSSASEQVKIAALAKEEASAARDVSKPSEPLSPKEVVPPVEAATPQVTAAQPELPAIASASDAEPAPKHTEGRPPADAPDRLQAAKRGDDVGGGTHKQRIALRAEAPSNTRAPRINPPEEHAVLAAPDQSGLPPAPTPDEKPLIIAATNPREAELTAEKEYEGGEATGLIDPVPLPPRRPVLGHSNRGSASARRDRPREATFVPLKNSLFEALFGGMAGTPFTPPPPPVSNRTVQAPFLFPPPF